MSEMIVDAVQLILIMRRDMRIVRLHAAGLFRQSRQGMAFRTGFERRFCRLILIGTMAGLARNAELGMPICQKISSLNLTGKESDSNKGYCGKFSFHRGLSGLMKKVL